ncbi:MAG: hypothetical protein HYT29_01135 [Parcubacteria group bacterium]|nr:hypothetical protein [Parcubacteria group bacterium]
MPPQAPYQQQQNNPPFNQPFNQPAGGDSFNKPMLWLIIGGAALFVIIAVALFFGSGLGKSEDEIKAEILRSLSAPSNAPEISAEEKQQILESLSAEPVNEAKQGPTLRRFFHRIYLVEKSRKVGPCGEQREHH